MLCDLGCSMASFAMEYPFDLPLLQGNLLQLQLNRLLVLRKITLHFHRHGKLLLLRRLLLLQRLRKLLFRGARSLLSHRRIR